MLLAVFATWRVRRAWPQTAGKIAVPGLSAPVQVIRDRWGVPSLYAANEHDLFFAQGYVHAQDRLWQMDFNRRLGAGELSSLFGRRVLATDRSLRTLRIRSAAERGLAGALARRPAPSSRPTPTGSTPSSNPTAAGCRSSSPSSACEPAPWTPVDSIAWSKMIAFSLGQNQTLELMRAPSRRQGRRPTARAS